MVKTSLDQHLLKKYNCRIVGLSEPSNLLVISGIEVYKFIPFLV